MNKNLTEIAFILDRSGSMQSVASTAIAGFNNFLRDQQAAEGQAALTLVLFDDEYLVPADNLPVQNVVPLNTGTYIPRGCTALIDAIGETIDRAGKRLEQTPEADRPGKVIVAILTDGEENSSKKYTWKDVARMIKHQTNIYHWEFLFLGANQDAIATASKLNISANNAARYVADGIGTKSSYTAISRKSVALRAQGSGKKLSRMQEEEAAQALSELLAEEDEKERRKK